MDNPDSFDADNIKDNLSNAELAAGSINYGAPADTQTLNTGEVMPINSFTSRRVRGVDHGHLPAAFFSTRREHVGRLRRRPGGPFDFVLPEDWRTPIILKTQTGRSIQFYSPLYNTPGNTPTLHGGLSDTFELTEVVWQIKVRRLMVPFCPSITIAAYTNKINNGYEDFGNLDFPPGTLHFETPNVLSRRLRIGR